MAMSNTYGNNPRPSQGVRQVADRDTGIRNERPDCAQAVRDATAQCEADSRTLHMDMGGRHA